jgi:cell surface protein SprA
MYSINSFTQNLLYQHATDNMDMPVAYDAVGNFIPRYDIQQISIAEQFSPLISADVTLKNSLQARFEIRRDRTLTLAYSNIQVTEVRGVEYIVGIGYRIKNMKIPFQSGGRKTRLPNDVNLKADIGLRDNTTIIRKLTERTNQASAGNKMLSIKLSADYNINDRFNVRVFFDRIANTPFVSASYPTSETSAGFQLRFTLAQ